MLHPRRSAHRVYPHLLGFFPFLFSHLQGGLFSMRWILLNKRSKDGKNRIHF